MMLARDWKSADGAMLAGSPGLSLFFAEMRDDQGKLNGIRIQRLKNKLGTKALPTAELELDGTKGELVGSIGRGTPTISTVLNISEFPSSCDRMNLTRLSQLIPLLSYCLYRLPALLYRHSLP